MNSCPRCESSIFAEDNYCGTCGYEVNRDAKIPLMTKKDIKVEDVRANLGMVYFKMGKYAQAQEIFETIRENDPQNKLAQNILNHIEEIRKKDDTKILTKV